MQLFFSFFFFSFFFLFHFLPKPIFFHPAFQTNFDSVSEIEIREYRCLFPEFIEVESFDLDPIFVYMRSTYAKNPVNVIYAVVKFIDTISIVRISVIRQPIMQISLTEIYLFYVTFIFKNYSISNCFLSNRLFRIKSERI